MGSPLVTVALVLLLVATMLTVGTSLTVRGFHDLLGRPLALVAAVVVNVVAIPAVTVGAVVLLDLNGAVAYGLILAAAAPGGGTLAARRAVAMTTTIRNLSLALLVAGLSADAAAVGLTVLAYGLVMYAVSGLALIPLRRTTLLRKELA